jgi:predicted PurR-regulated permease PerM
MEVTVLIITLCTIIIIACLMVYKRYLPDYYDDLIKEKKETIKQLDEEISNKSITVNYLNNNDIDYIKFKLENISNNNHNSILPYTFIFIAIATGIILYFTYKWTYYIQPETINNMVGDVSNSFQGLFN